MGVLTIPRTIAACCRGYYKAWRSPLSSEKLQMVGIGRSNPYRSSHFSGIFDFDIFGHMNHAVYLQHAELARWEISAMNGSLSWCIKENTGFVAVGLAARYRKEVGMFRRFEIETSFATCDEQNFWIYHTFRYPSCSTTTSPRLGGSNENKNRILFQTLIQASLVKNGKAINPKAFLERLSTENPNLIQELSESNDEIMLKKMSSFQQIEQVLRESAAIDDDMIQQHGHTKPKSTLRKPLLVVEMLNDRQKGRKPVLLLCCNCCNCYNKVFGLSSGLLASSSATKPELIMREGEFALSNLIISNHPCCHSLPQYLPPQTVNCGLS